MCKFANKSREKCKFANRSSESVKMQPSHQGHVIYNWLLSIADKKKTDISNIAKECGFSPSTLTRYKDENYTGSPKLNVVVTVMNRFNTPFPIDELVDGPIKKSFGKEIDTCSVYLWTWGELKLDTIDLSNNLAPDGGPRQVMYHTASDRENVIALPVVDDVMDAIAPKGSIIFVDHDATDLEHDGIYVVLFRGAAIFRRFRNDGGVDRLEPQGMVHKDETIFPRASDELKVIGRVFHVGREL